MIAVMYAFPAFICPPGKTFDIYQKPDFGRAKAAGATQARAVDYCEIGGACSLG